MSGGNHIRVYCRIRRKRSDNLGEDESSMLSAKVINDESGESVTEITIAERSSSYFVDEAYDQHTQAELYEDSAQSALDDWFKGMNCSFFTYGQTGSGKTYTIIGEADESRGLLPRAVEDIFSRIEQLSLTSSTTEAAQQVKVTVKASILEIYHEKLKDLLNFTPKPPNLAIREQSDGTIWVENCVELEIKDPSDYQRYLTQALRRRVTGGHKLNERSSRSHLCCLLSLHQLNSETNDILSSKLSIIDLAGSEMAKKTGASGKRFDEAKFINKSLSALSKVISALAQQSSQSQSTSDTGILTNTRNSFSLTMNSTKQLQPGSTAGHIPFRDSKLTRLLQSSLSGNSKTIILLTISDAMEHINETISTLKFGERARLVMTKPKINRLKQLQQQQMNAGLAAEEANKWAELVSTLKAQVTALTSTIEELKAKENVNGAARYTEEQGVEMLCEVCRGDILNIDYNTRAKQKVYINNSSLDAKESASVSSLNPLYALNPISLPLCGNDAGSDITQWASTDYTSNFAEPNSDSDDGGIDQANLPKGTVYESEDEVIDRCGICGLSSDETYTLREDTGEYLGVLFSCDGNCGSHFHSRCVGLIGDGGQYSIPDGEWYCTVCEADLQQHHSNHRHQQQAFIMNGSAMPMQQRQPAQSVASSVDEFVTEDHLHSTHDQQQWQQRYDTMRKERNRVLQHWQQEKKRMQSQENRRQQRVIALEEDQLAVKEELLTVQDQLRQQQVENEALRQCIKDITTTTTTVAHHSQPSSSSSSAIAKTTVSPNSRIVKLLSSSSMSALTQSKELEEFIDSLSSLQPLTGAVHKQFDHDESEMEVMAAAAASAPAESPTTVLITDDRHHQQSNHSNGGKNRSSKRAERSDASTDKQQQQPPLTHAQIQSLGKTIQDALQHNRSTPRKDLLPSVVVAEDMADQQHDTITPPLDAAKEPPSRFLNPLKNRLTELLALVREETDSYAEIRAKAQRREELRGGVNSNTNSGK